MMKSKKLIALISCFSLLFCLASCGGSQTQAGSQSASSAQSGEAQSGKKVIRIGWTNTTETFNPINTAWAINSASNYPTELMYLPLVQLGADNVYHPQLASSIETEDNKTFTVTLASEANWTDGTPVTADDLLYTVDVITNPAVGSSLAYYFNILEGTDDAGTSPDGVSGTSVIKVNDKTVQMITKYEVPLDLFNDFIGKNLKCLPSHVFSDVDPATLYTNPQIVTPEVTNGPFTLEEFQAGQYVRLSANPDYFKGAPKLDELYFVTLNSSNITAQLLSGEIDMNWPSVGNIPISDYETVETAENLQAYRVSSCTNQVLWMNNDTISDVCVRKAISAAIDRPLIADSLLKGYAEALVLPFPSISPYYDADNQDIALNQDLARELLEEAGWDGSQALNFLVPTGNTGRVSAAEMIVENLRAVGITAQITSADFSTTVANVREGEYDLSILGCSAPPTNPSSMISYLYATDSGMNYDDPEMDDLIKQAQLATDPADMAEIYAKIQEKLLADMPACVVYGEAPMVAVNTRVTYGEPADYGAFVDVELWDVA